MSEEYLKYAREVIGDFLKQTREGKGLSRYNVAKQAGQEKIDPVVRIEREENYSSIDTVIALSESNGYIHLFLRKK